MIDEPSLIVLDGISHAYGFGGTSHQALSSTSFSIQRGDSCAITGPSGSGKSTLLNIIGLLDSPSSGQLRIAGRELASLSLDERARVRNELIGFIFQSFNLLPLLSALDNVALPLFYRGLSRSHAHELALQQLERVGLLSHIAHRPSDMSGGQRQRVAIARALVGNPSLVLADEPTGNLDKATAEDVMALLMQLNREQGMTLIMVTHDATLASKLDRCFYVEAGVVIEKSRRPTSSDV